MGRIALFLILVGVPILEIALFIQVGGVIGLWPTLAIVVLTAFAGTVLMRVQGLQALAQLRGSLEHGANPVGPIAHGAMILVAGILLLTPGFFTDAVGLSLLVPPVRKSIIRWGANTIRLQTVHVRTDPAPRGPARDTTTRDTTARDAIDADYQVMDEDADEIGRRGQSGWTTPRD